MGNKDNSMIGKELNIFFSRFDRQEKVGAIKLAGKDLDSKDDFIKALQKVTGNLENKSYSINSDNGLFARFNLKDKEIKLHRWSENTGILMPCWNHFDE